MRAGPSCQLCLMAPNPAAGQREAQEALKSAEAAKAAATAEAKRSGETKLASLPNPEARPFAGHWVVNQVSNGNCARATGSWRLQIQGSAATAFLDGVTRRGSVRSNGAFRVESRDASGHQAGDLYRHVERR